MTFADAIAVRRHSPGVYRAEVPRGWDIAGATDGGYLMALVTNAVLDATGQTDPVTITVHYLAPVRPGAVAIAVDTIRSGPRLSTATATMRDDAGHPLLIALASVGAMPDAETLPPPTLAEDGPPDLPALPECVLIEPTDSFPPPFMGQVRLWLPEDSTPFATGGDAGPARMRGWFALPDDAPLDTLAVLLAADAFPPPVFNARLPIGWTPTVELTVQVRARPSGSTLRCTFRTRFVTNGLLEADGEIWDETDTLVALSRQLALVPRA